MFPAPCQCFPINVDTNCCPADIDFAPSCTYKTSATEVLSEVLWNLQHKLVVKVDQMTVRLCNLSYLQTYILPEEFQHVGYVSCR